MTDSSWLAVATIAAALISGYAAVRAAGASRKADKIHETVGIANGNGTLAQMNEKMLGAAFELLAAKNDEGDWREEHSRTDEENDTASRARDEAASARLSRIEEHLGIDNPKED